MKVNTKNLSVAEVRYYDLEKNGLEYTPPLSHVVLLNRGDTYVNLFNCADFAPVYTRVKNVSNRFKDSDEFFGTKINLVCGEVQSGEAWLINDIDFSEVFNTEEVDVDDVENYVLESDLFFKDRLEIIATLQKRYILPEVSVRSIIEKDQKLLDEMNAFFAEREKQKVKQK